jgi:hypothetical protein
MDDNILLGVGRHLVPVPRAVWQGHAARDAEHTDRGLAFMSEQHHRIRNFVVRELPRVGEPLAPEFIAQALQLPFAEVVAILDELESNMTFLFRNPQRAVTWAYPVTVDVTPHRVTLSSGEGVYAA